MPGLNHHNIRQRFLRLHPAVFAVTIREHPRKMFDLFAGFARWKHVLLRLLGYPRHVLVEPPTANVTVFIFGTDFPGVAATIRQHEEKLLKPTGVSWNFEIYQMDPAEFRTYTPFN